MSIDQPMPPYRMRKLAPIVLLLILASPFASASLTRHGRFVFTARITDLPTDAESVTLWVPIPSTGRDQIISEVLLDSDYKWTFAKGAKHGNQYAWTTIEEDFPEVVEVRVSFKVERRTVLFDRLEAGPVTQEQLRQSLLPSRLVTISPRIQTIATQITRGTGGVLEEARAIYDYVLATMKFDETEEGWGRGDTERACDIRSGNCTDFHSLFISLARARGIPARFIMGMPLLAQDEPVTSYRCWAEFYLQSKGWVPVDPSEASKTTDPAIQNFLFGNLDYDRIGFSIGRDIVLDPATAQPLNYMIYPYAEADGKMVGQPSISLDRWREESRPAAQKR